MRSKAAGDLAEKVSPKRVMSAADLARELGVSPQAVSGWIHGRALPSAEYMARLEDLLGIPMRDWTEPAPEATGTDGGN
jgi:transcriptional regulator with XRE-family HTH domain